MEEKENSSGSGCGCSRYGSNPEPFAMATRSSFCGEERDSGYDDCEQSPELDLVAKRPAFCYEEIPAKKMVPHPSHGVHDLSHEHLSSH